MLASCGRLLFGPGELADSWDFVAAYAGANTAPRLAALQILAAHRDKLPGIVFFSVPEGAEEDAAWRELIRVTEPYCRCESRRVIYPARGRSRLITTNPPRLVTVRYDHAAEAQWAALYLAPHGGNQVWSYGVWRIDASDVMASPMPHLPKPPTVRYVYDQICTPSTKPHDYDSWQRTLGGQVGVEWELKYHGEIAFTQTTLHSIQHWPTCSIVGVNRDEPGVTTVTFEVDAAVAVVAVVQGPVWAPQHYCTNDAD